MRPMMTKKNSEKRHQGVNPTVLRNVSKASPH